jgi:hypothetical protein
MIQRLILSFVAIGLLFGAVSASAHTVACEDVAKAAAVTHLIQKYGEEITTNLSEPETFTIKDQEKEYVRVVFMDRNSPDNNARYVDVLTTDYGRKASKTFRCLIYKVEDGILKDDPR